MKVPLSGLQPGQAIKLYDLDEGACLRQPFSWDGRRHLQEVRVEKEPSVGDDWIPKVGEDVRYRGDPAPVGSVVELLGRTASVQWHDVAGRGAPLLWYAFEDLEPATTRASG